MPSPFPNLPLHQRGRVLCVAHTSDALAENPWGDPAQRDLWVYLPPGYDATEAHYPVVMLLSGYAGTGESMLARGLTDVSIASRIDRLLAASAGSAGGDGPTCPPFIAVLPDCMTHLGGSQFVDSPGMGNYATWLVDELRPFIDRQLRTTGRWAVAGRSSGGFGALHLAMSYPGAFAAVACHAGDMGFDLCWLGDIQRSVAGVQAAGGIEPFLATCWQPRHWSPAHFSALMILAMSCCFSPDPDALGPVPARLPVDFQTGRVDFDVIRSWQRFDPLQRALDPGVLDALRALDLLYLDAGSRDEYLLHLGARRFVAQLAAAGVPHTYQEFPGGHRGTAYRWDVSLPLIARALETGNG
ncbi:MAG: esterase [Oligoflexia bacterium]|nr:esterase [Oligoflexia bacterium]